MHIFLNIENLLVYPSAVRISIVMHSDFMVLGIYNFYDRLKTQTSETNKSYGNIMINLILNQERTQQCATGFLAWWWHEFEPVRRAPLQILSKFLERSRYTSSNLRRSRCISLCIVGKSQDSIRCRFPRHAQQTTWLQYQRMYFDSYQTQDL